MSVGSVRDHGMPWRSIGGDPEEPDTHPGSSPAVAELLREWRAAERALADLEPGSDAWARLVQDIEQLRQRYQEAFDALTHTDPGGPSA